jgi:hypothetical protein
MTFLTMDQFYIPPMLHETRRCLDQPHSLHNTPLALLQTAMLILNDRLYVLLRPRSIATPLWTGYL